MFKNLQIANGIIIEIIFKYISIVDYGNVNDSWLCKITWKKIQYFTNIIDAFGFNWNDIKDKNSHEWNNLFNYLLRVDGWNKINNLLIDKFSSKVL